MRDNLLAPVNCGFVCFTDLPLCMYCMRVSLPTFMHFKWMLYFTVCVFVHKFGFLRSKKKTLVVSSGETGIGDFNINKDPWGWIVKVQGIFQEGRVSCIVATAGSKVSGAQEDILDFARSVLTIP